MLSGGVQEIALLRDAGGERWYTSLTGRKSCLYQPDVNASGECVCGQLAPSAIFRSLEINGPVQGNLARGKHEPPGVTCLEFQSQNMVIALSFTSMDQSWLTAWFKEG